MMSSVSPASVSSQLTVPALADVPGGETVITRVSDGSCTRTPTMPDCLASGGGNPGFGQGN